MDNPKITEEEIRVIKAAQAGNILAFNKLFKKYKGFVDNLLFQYIKDMDEAKDITNIVFLKVYNNLSKFTDYSSFGGWLRILTKNVAIDYLRRIKLKNVSDDFVDCLENRNIAHDQGEEDLVNRLTYQEIKKYFSTLPLLSQKVLELFYENGMTVVQISEALNVPTGTIKSILFRTRNKLKNNLKL